VMRSRRWSSSALFCGAQLGQNMMENRVRMRNPGI
jgi:hypothetical protein